MKISVRENFDSGFWPIKFVKNNFVSVFFHSVSLNNISSRKKDIYRKQIAADLLATGKLQL